MSKFMAILGIVLLLLAFFYKFVQKDTLEAIWFLILGYEMLKTAKETK